MIELTQEEKKHLFTLLQDISTLAKQQTEKQMQLAEELIASTKSSNSVVKFTDLKEANAFLNQYKTDNNIFLMKLTDIISNSYLDDLVGQKVNQIKRSLLNMDDVLSYILVDDNELDSLVNNEKTNAQDYADSLGI